MCLTFIDVSKVLYEFQLTLISECRSILNVGLYKSRNITLFMRIMKLSTRAYNVVTLSCILKIKK